MNTTVCECCGGKIEYKYESTKPRFCSHACANRTNRAKRKTAEMQEFTCRSCGKKFLVKKHDYRVKAGTVKYCSHKCSGEGNKTGKMVECRQCGKLFYTTRNEFCSHRCVAEYLHENAERKPYFENGYIVHHVRGYNKKGNAKEHRLVAERMIGRPLKNTEVVHHINGDRADNRPENLIVMSRGEHSRLHRMAEVERGKPLFGRR